MHIRKLFKPLVLPTFILTALTLKLAASVMNDLSEDHYHVIRFLNTYIEDNAQGNTHQSCEVTNLIQQKTLAAHFILNYILLGYQITLPLKDKVATLSFKTINDHPEIVDQFLLGNVTYTFQKDQIPVSAFNLFAKREPGSRMHLVQSVNTLIDLAINDFHIPSFKKTFKTRYIFREAAEHIARLTKPENNLFYVHHIFSLIYYYDYLKAILDKLYNPYSFLNNIEDIQKNLSKKTYYYCQKNFSSILKTHRLTLPNTPQSIKSFLGKAGLTPDDIQELLILKLSKLSRLSQLWAVNDNALKEAISIKWGVSKWDRWRHDSLEQHLPTGRPHDQAVEDIYEALMATPFRKRGTIFNYIRDSYELSPTNPETAPFIKSLLRIPNSLWPELNTYVKHFISLKTPTPKKIIILNAFENILYESWPDFFTACMQLTGERQLSDPCDAGEILYTMPAYKWQKFIIYVREFIPYTLNTSDKLINMKLLSQFSRKEWYLLAKLIKRLSPFKNEMDKIKIIEALSYLQPDNRLKFLSFIEIGKIQDINAIMTLAIRF